MASAAYQRKYRELNRDKVREYDKTRYLKHKESRLQSAKNYYAENKEETLMKLKSYRKRSKEQRTMWSKKYYEKNRETILEKSRLRSKNVSKLKKYNITQNDYNTMLEQQNFCCQICKKKNTEFKFKLAVDHCHTTNKIRGLLCSSCNTALGSFKDNIEILSEAIKYLEKNRE